MSSQGRRIDMSTPHLYIWRHESLPKGLQMASARAKLPVSGSDSPRLVRDSQGWPFVAVSTVGRCREPFQASSRRCTPKYRHTTPPLALFHRLPQRLFHCAHLLNPLPAPLRPGNVACLNKTHGHPPSSQSASLPYSHQPHLFFSHCSFSRDEAKNTYIYTLLSAYRFIRGLSFSTAVQTVSAPYRLSFALTAILHTLDKKCALGCRSGIAHRK